MTSVNPTGSTATGSTGGVTAPGSGAATGQARPPVTVWREKTSSYTGGTNGTGGPYGADGVASTFVARGTDVLMALLLAATAATTFLAATPWLRAYEVARAPLILALAAILPVVIAGGLSWVLRLQPVVSYAASAAGIAVFAWVVNGFDLGAVWDGVVHVPAQLLSETLPLSGSPYLLSAPVLLTWSCGAISAELFVRPTRPSSAGLLVPLAYFALAFVATTSAPAGAGVAAGVVLLGALMLCALARHAVLERQRALVEAGPEGRAARRSASLRSAVAGTALAALLVAALALAIPGSFSLSGKAATVSRSTHLRSGIVVDPLDALASLRDSDPGAPPVTLFKVSVQQSWSGYVALAALDDYDGDSWSFSATFRPTGGRVPEPTIGATTGGERVVQHYTLERAIGLPFLPAQDRPVQVTGVPADADATTGMLTAAPSLPASYTVVSRVPAGTLSELNPGSPIAFGDNVPGGDLPAYIALPAGSAKDIAPAARFAAHLTGEKVSPTLTFLQALAVALQGHERRVEPRRGGEQRPGQFSRPGGDISGPGNERSHRRPCRYARAVRHVLRRRGPLPRCARPRRDRFHGPRRCQLRGAGPRW